MAGLIKDEVFNEIVVELSWVMKVIDDICEKMGIETYHTVLIKNRIQAEEEKALDQFLFSHWKDLDHLSMEEIEEGVSKLFYEQTKKQWAQPVDLLETLVKLWKEETKLNHKEE